MKLFSVPLLLLKSWPEYDESKTILDVIELPIQVNGKLRTTVEIGKDASDNVVVKEGGVIPELGEDALCHWDLCKKFNLIDFDLGVKITGAGFPLYIGKMARFQRALEAFFLEEARKSGYLEVQPPFVVNQASGYGTGQLPDKEGQMYHVQLDDLYLIPTAEVPVTNIFNVCGIAQRTYHISNIVSNIQVAELR